MNLAQFQEAVKRSHEKFVVQMDEAYGSYRNELIAAMESLMGTDRDSIEPQKDVARRG